MTRFIERSAVKLRYTCTTPPPDAVHGTTTRAIWALTKSCYVRRGAPGASSQLASLPTSGGLYYMRFVVTDDSITVPRVTPVTRCYEVFGGVVPWITVEMIYDDRPFAASICPHQCNSTIVTHVPTWTNLLPEKRAVQWYTTIVLCKGMARAVYLLIAALSVGDTLSSAKIPTIRGTEPTYVSNPSRVKATTLIAGSRSSPLTGYPATSHGTVLTDARRLPRVWRTAHVTVPSHCYHNDIVPEEAQVS